MSVKRQATTELNHENWDQDDPSDQEDKGTFKTASKDILERRVIRTAKRRVAQDEAKKSVFSGFGGFNKPPPSSFDFLANLTNGNKTNGSSTETAVSSSLFGNKASNSGGLFNIPVSSSTVTKSTFGSATTTSTLFGGSSTSPSQSPFTASKADSTVADTAFKIQPTSSSSANSSVETTSKTTVTNSTSLVTSTMFGIPATNSTNNNSLFSATSNNTSPFKIQPVSTSSAAQNDGTTIKQISNGPEKKVESKADEKKLTYYAKLKGLNESVSDWIKKHVEETPLCILSPIFKDYENHLKQIQDEYHGTGGEPVKKQTEDATTETKSDPEPSQTKTTRLTNNNTGLFASTPKSTIFGNQTNANTSGFSFGINAATSNVSNTLNSITTTNTTSTSGFSFGIKQSTTTSSPFSATTSTTIANGTAAFSFGIGKPFSFSPNVQKPTTENQENEAEEDEPPKVEFTPVVEENSVFEKRCKIFVKKDGNYVDKGLGTLYVKKIEDTGKHQLLVRANTSLGNILLNLILTSSIPTQRLGKNNVMLVCIPTPDAKPPPTPILIRVKTSEEADSLLETLNKFKE